MIPSIDERGEGPVVRVSQVRVRGYRSIEDLTIDVDDYMPMVGANGSGKSSLLYALDWFFNGVMPSAEDVHSTAAMVAAKTPTSDIDVEVTFSDLTTEDRAALGPYGQGSVATFRRCWSAADSKEKLLGNSRQGPGFAAIRAPGLKAKEMKELYAAAGAACAGLPAEAGTMDAIRTALDEWEAKPENLDLLEEVVADDATHMFGINGEHTLSRRIRFILIPASTDLAAQVGSTNRGSALQELVGALMAGAVAAARTKWEQDNATQIADLESAIAAGVASSTQRHADRVNGLLAELVPNAKVEFRSSQPAWALKGDTTILTNVVIDGECKDVSRQGHGIQRALMMAMLQARVPDEDFIKLQLADAGTEPEEIDAQLEAELAKLPSLIVAIEEPEIYQHPVRARHFARILSRIAARLDTQVLIATHSPYFVLPEQFESLRRFSLSEGKTVVSSTSITDVATASGKAAPKIKKAVEKEIPRTFSEGFFADAVVLVEGDTDRVVLEAIGEQTGMSLDALGIAVLAVGSKESLRIPREILECVDVPVYVVADADGLGAGDGCQSESAKSHKKSTADLHQWLPAGTSKLGSNPFSWGDQTTVTSRWTLFHGDLEHELEGWPSFMAALSEAGSALGSKDVGAYRSAAMSASSDDLPASLLALVGAVRDLPALSADLTDYLDG
jgi:putative ATP-dependent endonuclease of OLD family